MQLIKNIMASRSCLLASLISKVTGDHVNRSIVKIGDRYCCQDNKVVGHVPEALAKKYTNTSRNKHWKKLNVIWHSRTAPEGKWVIGGDWRWY